LNPTAGGKEGQPDLRDFFALRRKIAQIRPSPILPDDMRDGKGLGKDFIAVFYVGPDAHFSGKLVAMLPIGEAAMAHHTNYELSVGSRGR